MWFLGRSSLRTTEKVRMWILLPAVLALKKRPEQMASQIWVPLCPQGRWLTNDSFYSSVELIWFLDNQIFFFSSLQLLRTNHFLYKVICVHTCSSSRTVSFCIPSAGHTPQRQLYTSELLDIYCSQCCKKVNLLNDLEARLRNLKANRWNMVGWCGKIMYVWVINVFLLLHFH